MALQTTTQVDDVIEGDVVTISAQFYAADGVTEVDPAVVTLTIEEQGCEPPDPIVATKAGGDFDNPSTGLYQYAYEALVPGMVSYHFHGSTPADPSARGVKGVLNVETAP